MANTVISKSSISIDLAQAVAAAAVAKGVEMGKAFAVAITDEAGHLKAFTRMDGSPLLASEIAINKAKTAIGFGFPTHGWYDFIKDDGPLALGAPHIRDLVIYGGGYPIVVDGAQVGAIGVSGGHYSEDMQVAEAGLAITT